MLLSGNFVVLLESSEFTNNRMGWDLNITSYLQSVEHFENAKFSDRNNNITDHIQKELISLIKQYRII